MITGSGAVGSFLKKFIKSGSEKKPARTKNKNDNLFKTPKSLNESDPYMIKIIPKIVNVSIFKYFKIKIRRIA